MKHLTIQQVRARCYELAGRKNFKVIGYWPGKAPRSLRQWSNYIDRPVPAFTVHTPELIAFCLSEIRERPKTIWHTAIPHEVAHLIHKDELNLDSASWYRGMLSGGHTDKWAATARGLGCLAVEGFYTTLEYETLEQHLPEL